MRLIHLATVASVACNVVQAVVLLHPRLTGSASHPGGAALPATVKTAESVRAPSPSFWQTLHADEKPATLVERLRAAGFPPGVIRQVTAAVVGEYFDAERAKLDPASLATPYWKKWPESWLDPKIGPELRRLAREQEAMMKDLLGEDVAETEEQRAWAEQRYGTLDREQRRRVEALEREYNEKAMQALSGSRNAFLPSDVERYRATEREKMKKMGEFLSPEQLTDYVHRNGPAAATLKFMLGPSEVSESEFRALVPLYQQFLDQVPNAQPFGSVSHLSPEQAAARTLAANALANEMGAAFGASRAEELKLALDFGFMQQAMFTNRLNLPVTVARELHTIGNEAARQAEQLQADQSLTTEQRNARLQSVSRAAGDRISAVLRSDDDVRAYHLYTQNWLLNLGKPKP